MEQRQFSRVPFRMEVHLVCDGEEIQATVENISLYGILIRSDKKLEPGKETNIHFRLLSDSSSLELNMKGVVVRSESSHEFAIEFREVDLDTFIHLKHILEYNSGDPDRIQKEFHDYMVRRAGT